MQVRVSSHLFTLIYVGVLNISSLPKDVGVLLFYMGKGTLKM